MSNAACSVSSNFTIAFCRAGFASASERSANCRHTEVFERIAGSAARCSIQSACCTQRSSAAALASARAISADRPPVRSAQSSANSQSSTASIDGVLIVSPLKMPSISCAAFGQPEDLGQRPRRGLAFEPLDRARRQHQHAVAGFAAQRLLPAESADIDFRPVDVLGECRRRRVADGEAGAVGGDPVGVGHPHAAGGAVPGEHDVLRRVDPAQVRDLAIVGGAHLGVELELLDHIGDPAGAEAFPGEHRHGPRAQQRPQGQLHRPGVGGGDDAEPIVGREGRAAHGCARSLAASRALPSAERCERPSERVSSSAADQPGGLAQGPEEKKGRAGKRGGTVNQIHSPHREHAPRWDGVARRQPYGDDQRMTSSGGERIARRRSERASRAISALVSGSLQRFTAGSGRFIPTSGT